MTQFAYETLNFVLSVTEIFYALLDLLQIRVRCVDLNLFGLDILFKVVERRLNEVRLMIVRGYERAQLMAGFLEVAVTDRDHRDGAASQLAHSILDFLLDSVLVVFLFAVWGIHTGH